MPPEASSSCTTYRARGASASARPAATPDRGGLLEMDTVDIIVAALPARPRNGHQYTVYRFLPLHAAGGRGDAAHYRMYVRVRPHGAFPMRDLGDAGHVAHRSARARTRRIRHGHRRRGCGH